MKDKLINRFLRCLFFAIFLSMLPQAALHAQHHPDEKTKESSHEKHPQGEKIDEHQDHKQPEVANHEDHQMQSDKPSEGSGTSWLPSETPMNAIHGKWNEWKLMLHYQIYLQYIETTGKRGDQQGGSINWIMAMMERESSFGKLGFRSMLSLEPWTVGKCGFPDLLQTGEECHGERLHDRQHPHDLFMEIAGYWDKPLTENLNLKVYAAPAGEPALGPTAFPHRPSAFPTPIAPISHHWLDASHISFGVLTLGLYNKTSMLESSAFNGREPDENRSDLDLDPLDSYSGRFTLMPNKEWVLQISGAYLREGEAPEEEGEKPHDLKRYTASMTTHKKMANRWLFSTLAYGFNQHEKSDSSAALFELSLNTESKRSWGFRGEWVQKTSHDLVLDEAVQANRKFDLGKLSFSVLQEFKEIYSALPGLGFSIDVSSYPKDLETYYGDRPRFGYVIFASLRPMAMDPGEHHKM